MPRRNANSDGIKWTSPGSKGTSRKGKRRGAYSLKNKRIKADHYDRPYIDKAH